MARGKRVKRNGRAIPAAAFAAVLFFAFLLVFQGCAGGSAGAPTEPASVETASAEEEPAEAEPAALQIVAVGDVIVHLAQIAAQYDSATDAYDFSDNFQYVKKYIESADFALCNLETTFAGPPYTGYPLFSAPEALAPALKDLGFDVAVFANNHVADKGVAGLQRTLDVLRENRITPAGVRADPAEPRHTIYEANGVKIGVVAYTYASSSAAGAPLINGASVSAELAALVNYFRYGHLDEDLEEVKKTVTQAKNAGAEIVIAYYHWGEEYQLKANRWQRYIAEKTVNEMDVDIIFGTHPHTLQEMDFLTKEGTGKRVPVFFSMGNFISNQRQETLDNRYTEIGVIARVDLTYDKEEKEIISIQMSAVPTWVDKYRSGGKDAYAVIPLDEDLDANATLAASGHLGRAKRAWEDANGILGQD